MITPNVEHAFTYLKQLINSSWEYPDAEYRASVYFKLSDDEVVELRKMYDGQ